MHISYHSIHIVDSINTGCFCAAKIVTNASIFADLLSLDKCQYEFLCRLGNSAAKSFCLGRCEAFKMTSEHACAFHATLRSTR